MICPNCGLKTEIEDRFCMSCGFKLENEGSEPLLPSKGWLLWIALPLLSLLVLITVAVVFSAQDYNYNYIIDNAEVVSLRFFEFSGETNHEKGNYSGLFSAEQARFINWELELTLPAPGKNIEFPVTQIFFYDSGEIFCIDTAIFSVEADWDQTYLEWGYGWEKPGEWKAGRYEVELYIAEHLLASGWFEVY